MINNDTQGYLTICVAFNPRQKLCDSGVHPRFSRSCALIAPTGNALDFVYAIAQANHWTTGIALLEENNCMHTHLGKLVVGKFTLFGY